MHRKRILTATHDNRQKKDHSNNDFIFIAFIQLPSRFLMASLYHRSFFCKGIMREKGRTSVGEWRLVERCLTSNPPSDAGYCTQCISDTIGQGRNDKLE